MAVTIKDIARKLGLSITTVSRALGNHLDVNPKTKELIQRTAAEMGYTPNLMAQRLQKRKTDTIGLIIPTFAPRFSDPFFSEFLAGLGNKAAQLGYDLLVSTRAPGVNEMPAYHQMVDGHRADGLVVVRTRQYDERIHYLSSIQFPFVAFGRTDGGHDFLYVDEDGAYGMELVAAHLVEFGHTRIACISSPPELMFTHSRMQGLRTGLESRNIPLEENLIRTGDMTERSGYEQAMSLLHLPTPPTAIVVCNDLMAFGAMSAAQDYGMVVGQDISITGFDNIPMASHSHPPLTTVNQPIYQIGSMVCEMLIKCLKGQVLEQRQIILKPGLIMRHSSGPVKGGETA
jgi:LacI family transcriptional regulator